MTENWAVRTHRRLVMNRRVERLANHISGLIPDEARTVLDVGSGTGEIAQSILERRPKLEFSGVDVYIRPRTFIPVTEYDGKTLPFADGSFDVVTIVDVLHHCADPAEVLQECARVSRRWVIIKDHVANNLVSHGLLRFMDWIGNRGHGVVLPFNYLSSEGWESAIGGARLKSTRQLNHLNLYPFPFTFVFDGGLHFISILGKKDDPDTAQT